MSTVNPLERMRRLGTEPIQPIQSPYQRLYGLRENPFPSLALFAPTVDDPRRNGKIYDENFRRREEREFFQRFVQMPTGDRPFELGFIRLDIQAGARGNGKSIFLHHLMERINSQEWEDWTAKSDSPDLFAVAVHVLPEPRREKRFWQFARLIFETFFDEACLNDKTLSQVVTAQFNASILLSLLPSDKVTELATCPPEEISHRLETTEGLKELLQQYELTLAGFAEQAARQLRMTGPSLNEEFLKSFVASDAQLEQFWKNIRQSWTDYRWRGQGVDWLVNGLVPVLLLAGYRRLYVLLDEFEKIYIYQNIREREEFLDSLRQYFYERDSVAVRRRFITTILTVHPGIDRYMRDVWVRVGLDQLAPLDPQRIGNRAVILGPSNQTSLEGLLVTFLDAFRDGDQHKGTLYPFEAGALSPAMDAARYYPRGTLWYAYTILQKAAAEEVKPLISQDYVQAFVDSGLRPPTDEEDMFFKLPESQTRIG